MNDDRLRRRLNDLGRRILALGSGLGLGWGLATAGGVVASAVWLDLVFDLAGPVRLALVLAAGGLAVALVAVFVVRAWRKTDAIALANLLDASVGGRGRIAAGTDLALDGRLRSPLSSALARMAVDDASQWADRAPLAAAAPLRPLATPLSAVAALALLGFGVAVGLPRLAAVQWNRFTDPFGDHPPYSPLVLTVQPGDAKVHFGGTVDVVVEGTGAPIDKMELVVRGAEQDAVLPMFPETGDRWRTTLVQITEPARYFVRSGRARSDKYRVDVVTAPRITGLKINVVQPEYAYRAAYEGPIPKEGVAGLVGARVSFHVESNRPLREGRLAITKVKGGVENVTLAPTSEGSREVAGDFVIKDSGKFELRLVDGAGERSTESAAAAIHLLADERPIVRILEPRETSFATPTASLPVILSSEDDCSVAKLQLFRSLNGSRALPTDVVLPPPPVRRIETDVMLPLSAFGLRAGDEIQLFARAEDANPAGAQGSESSVVTIRIIEQSEYERLTQRQQGVEALLAKTQQAERRMESVVEEIEQLQKKLAEGTPKDGPLTKEERKELETLAIRLEEEAKAMEQLAKQKLPYDVDREASKEIAKLAEALQKAAAEAKKLAAKEGVKKPSAQDELKRLQKRLAQNREEFDQEAAKPIEGLAKAYALMEDEAKFLAIYRRQRDLEQRMASLRKSNRAADPAIKARMRDLETEQRGLREGLRDLLDDIEAHAAALPESKDLELLRETALKFAADVRASGAADSMASAEAALAEFAGSKSHSSAKEAADILEKFLSRCNGGGSMASACKNCLPKFQPKLSSCMGSTLDQLLANAGLGGAGAGDGQGAGGQPGMSPGSRDGYSMAANTLKNVGLYGNLPTSQASSGRGSGNRQSGDGRRLAAAPGTEQSTRVASNAGGDPKTASDAEGQVPPTYRRRVAEYFRRIADESTDR